MFLSNLNKISGHYFVNHTYIYLYSKTSRECEMIPLFIAKNVNVTKKVSAKQKFSLFGSICYANFIVFIKT